MGAGTVIGGRLENRDSTSRGQRGGWSMKHRDWKRPMVEREAQKDSYQQGNPVVGMIYESAHFGCIGVCFYCEEARHRNGELEFKLM